MNIISRSEPSRRGMLTGVMSLVPLVVVTDEARANEVFRLGVGTAVDPALEAEMRAQAGVKKIGPPKTKSFLSYEAPPTPKSKMELTRLKPKTAPAEAAAAPSLPSLPSLPNIELPKLPFR